MTGNRESKLVGNCNVTLGIILRDPLGDILRHQIVSRNRRVNPIALPEAVSTILLESRLSANKDGEAA
jgi:hypothetical protein